MSDKLQNDHPVLLLPLRLETRFLGNDLWVRIYPDQMFVDAHDSRLTQAELEAGQRYRAQVGNSDDEGDHNVAPAPPRGTMRSHGVSEVNRDHKRLDQPQTRRHDLEPHRARSRAVRSGRVDLDGHPRARVPAAPRPSRPAVDRRDVRNAVLDADHAAVPQSEWDGVESAAGALSTGLLGFAAR